MRSNNQAEIVEERAKQSLGMSAEAIYQMVINALDKRRISGDLVVDMGCGAGLFNPFLKKHFKHYVGVDIVRYDAFPRAAEFHQVNLDTGKTSLPANRADTVVSVETIEHIENPRAFVRELVRIAKPGGWVVVTTPNQESFLSLLTLIVKRRFAAFQEADYPAHITALLEVDLVRIATECGLENIAVHYSLQGRIALTPLHFPRIISRCFPRLISDNLLVIGSKARGWESGSIV